MWLTLCGQQIIILLCLSASTITKSKIWRRQLLSRFLAKPNKFCQHSAYGPFPRNVWLNGNHPLSDLEVDFHWSCQNFSYQEQSFLDFCHLMMTALDEDGIPKFATCKSTDRGIFQLRSKRVFIIRGHIFKSLFFLNSGWIQRIS